MRSLITDKIAFKNVYYALFFKVPIIKDLTNVITRDLIWKSHNKRLITNTIFPKMKTIIILAKKRTGHHI